jgi:DNA invertase Pin-like site-specific DNA recombinase
MAKIGYARVSTADQNDDSQVDELKAYGCERIFIDHGVSGKLAARPELDKCVDFLREGDVLVVTRMSRAMRSLKHMLALVDELQAKGAGLKVLKQDIDTTTPNGRLIFHIFAAIDEFQRELIVEGTNEGLAAAKARGKLGGRKPSYTEHQAKTARSLHAQGELTAEEIGRVIGVSRATVYRMIKEDAQPAAKPGKAKTTPAATLASDEALAAVRAKLSREAS